MPDVRRLSLVVDSTEPNEPAVMVLLDGAETLRGPGADTRADPADLLDTGALLAQDPPRRIAIYGCGCGEFGCGALTVRISEEDGLVRWSDICELTGLYDSVLPPADEPDPLLADGDDLELVGRTGDRPDIGFDTEQYHQTVRAAMADRSWETRPRAVLRMLRERRPQWRHGWPSDAGITLLHDPRATETRLDVPAGPITEVVDRLLGLLDAGHDPPEIAARRLWR